MTQQALSWTAEEDGFTLLPIRQLAEITWREAQGEAELEIYVPKRGQWREVRGYWEPVLEGVRAGERLPCIVERVAKAVPERPPGQVAYIVRGVLQRLTGWEMITVDTPPAPAVFAGRYEVLEELGRGGMGIVWRCLDRETGAEVAVKHAWNWPGRFKTRERYLAQEAEAMATFDLPSVVRLIETFEHEGRLHLAREFVAGPPLKHLTRRRGLGPGDRRSTLAEMTRNLIAMRDVGYLCLDIKTSNYMYNGREGPLKLTDVGVVRPLDGGTVSIGGLPGTHRYADPSLMSAREATEVSCVYSLGKVLWEMVVRRSPTPRANYGSYFEQHELDIKALTEADALPEEVNLFCEACHPDPIERPPHLDAFLARLVW